MNSNFQNRIKTNLHLIDASISKVLDLKFQIEKEQNKIKELIAENEILKLKKDIENET